MAYRFPAIVSAYHFFLSFLGAVIYGFPSRRLTVIGITGTKGKTTALEIARKIFSEAGKETALLSSLTVAVGSDIEKNMSDTTMPGRFFIQRFLYRAAQNKCSVAFVEVTSQGIIQHRHRCIRWAAAGITNLQPEHIDAHGSYENYRAAKGMFFEYAVRQGARIFLNRDDGETPYFAEKCRGGNVMRYSARDIVEPVSEFLKSDFNKSNAALAVALARAFGIPESAIRRTLCSFEGIPGRMEFITREPFAVVVDYAHTPDSLRAVYTEIRGKTRGRLVCVLGSAGGGRDTWKRPDMGAVAAEFCDAIILTDEDSYDEDPALIVRSIETGAKKAVSDAEMRTILDRGGAIAEAIGKARPGDAVIITGKGSEMWMHMANGKKIPWSDKSVVKTVLAKKIPPHGVRVGEKSLSSDGGGVRARRSPSLRATRDRKPR